MADSQLFNNSELKTMLEENNIGMPFLVARQAIDYEGEYKQLLPCEWCQESHMSDGDHSHARNAATCDGFRQLVSLIGKGA